MGSSPTDRTSYINWLDYVTFNDGVVGSSPSGSTKIFVMTREQKIRIKKERASLRKQRRLDVYLRRKRVSDEYGIPLSAVDKDGYAGGYWPDPSSPTGYSQKCSYDAWGTCQYPCNGDC